MEQKTNSTVKTVSYMMIITLVGKVLGLVRDQFLAANYSVGAEAVAFLTASRIPRIFFDAVFASAISASFIPIFNEYMEKKGKKDAFSLSNQFITIIIIVTILMTIFGMVFSFPLARLFADGFDMPTAVLCSRLLRILFPAVIFTGIAFSFVGILQSMDEFGIPAAMSVASNLVVIVYYIFLNKRFGIYGLTVAFLIGWAMQAVIQLPALWKRGYHYRPDFHWKNQGLGKIGALMLPVMVSTWIQPINIFINTKFASRLYEGSGVAAIEYANNLYSIIIGVFVLSIANVIFPKLSRLGSNDQTEDFGETVGQTMESMAFLLIPMMIGLMLLSQPIVRLMYERAEFNGFATEITARALFFFSLGMLGFGIQTILSRAFYAVQDGKTPFYSGVASIVVNVVLCLLLVKPMNVGGLALASALSSMVAAVWLLVPMAKKYDIIHGGFWLELGKMVLAAIGMAIPVFFLRNLLVQGLGTVGLLNGILVVILPCGVGLLVYLVLAYVLRIEQCTYVIGFGKKMIGKVLHRG